MPVSSTIQQILQAEWPAVKRQLSAPPGEPFDPGFPPLMPTNFIAWSHRLTPGFPSLWPCPPDGQLIYYAWASGLQPNVLRGAVRTTAAWAQFIVSLADGNVLYERFGGNPEMADVQGVWALSPTELASHAESRILFDECPTVLSCQVSPPDHAWLQRAKHSYRFWIKCNGVIARQIRQTHNLFFACVESKP